jgi:hypothetical protein
MDKQTTSAREEVTSSFFLLSANVKRFKELSDVCTLRHWANTSIVQLSWVGAIYHTRNVCPEAVNVIQKVSFFPRDSHHLYCSSDHEREATPKNNRRTEHPWMSERLNQGCQIQI